MNAVSKFEPICLLAAKERVRIKILRSSPEVKHKPKANLVQRTIERPGMLGVVYATIGPREWTPRKVLPDEFETWIEFFRGDLLSIWENGRKVMIGIPSPREGLIGFLVPTSSYWNSWWKRPDYLRPKFGT